MMDKFTKEQLMKLAEFHLVEAEGMDIQVHIDHNHAHLWAHHSESRAVLASEMVFSQNFDQRIQSFLEKVKQVNHD
ncbi:MAG: hypothetical protein ACRCXK_13570 [Wohlfahrtiimonas sp.]